MYPCTIECHSSGQSFINTAQRLLSSLETVAHARMLHWQTSACIATEPDSAEEILLQERLMQMTAGRTAAQAAILTAAKVLVKGMAVRAWLYP